MTKGASDDATKAAKVWAVVGCGQAPALCSTLVAWTSRRRAAIRLERTALGSRLRRLSIR